MKKTISGAPEVSIITASYNSALYVEKTIKSVIQQSSKNWEMIIIDDCSTDNSANIIQKLADSESRIKFIRLDENVGAALARNAGLNIASGQFISFLDSDDMWRPKKLEQQLAFMKTNNHPISFTSYNLIDENSAPLNKTIKSVTALNLQQFLKNTRIGFSTSMIDTQLVKTEIKLEKMTLSEDANLWISLLKQGHIAYGLDEILVDYRVHSTSISSNKVKSAIQVWKLYFRIQKFGFIRSLYYFSFYAANAIKKRL